MTSAPVLWPTHKLNQRKHVGHILSIMHGFPTSVGKQCRQHRSTRCLKAAVPRKHHRKIAQVVFASATATQHGHSQLIHGLGDVGVVAPAHLPWLLRLAHISAVQNGSDSTESMQHNARGLMAWRAALERGLLPDDAAIRQLIAEGEDFTKGTDVEELHWPADPLRTMLIRALSKMGVARFAKKYPGVREALLSSLLETVCKYHRIMAGMNEVQEERETDIHGNVFKTAKEAKEEEAAKRATRAQQQQLRGQESEQKREPVQKKVPAAISNLPLDKRTALECTKELYNKWQQPIDTLSKAGRAFEGLEALLGGGASGSFDLQGNIWKRSGWGQMDELRRKLEDLKELRDVVRSLGRGGGWGPLRRAPVQKLDFNGRDGLLRTVLEAQETRGLTRSDDISRLLPSEAATLARGRRVRQAKLLFYAKLAEKGLQTYERDGWGTFPTSIIPERREIRPTADRGPILLCVDTSGSMRGPRETVAKALALECMRAAREQERGCYVFAFAGPREVRELELGNDMQSVNNLLEFLEKVFNGGSDFNEPVSRCLARLHEAAWANSDILLVSDGELRQPGVEVMRKLAGAKEKLGLRVHGLIVGSPEKKKADPAVLRSLCTNYLSNGKVEVCISLFEDWASVKADASLNFDWDDVEGNTRRRLAALAREKQRKQEQQRRRVEQRGATGTAPRAAKKH